MSVWKWVLENDDKTLVTGWAKCGDFWYYLNTNGTLQTGWWKDNNGKWYYFNENGQMSVGWIRISDKWYYLYEATNADQAEYIGTLAYNCTKTLNDGKSYTFDINGVMQESSSGLLSDSGADFIGNWEGLWLKAEYDPCYPGVDKYITIGYGTTKEARADAFPDGIDSTCTIEQARTWLKEEGQDKAETIKNDLDAKGITLAQNELDALISFAYNCGAGSLLGSTLYKNVIAGVRDVNTITSNFLAWNKANWKEEKGLTRRRNSEAALFLNSDYTGNC